MLSENKLVIALWIPAFSGFMAAAIANGYTDLWLFAILIGLVTWTACSKAVLLLKQIRHWAQGTKSPDKEEGTANKVPSPARDPLEKTP